MEFMRGRCVGRRGRQAVERVRERRMREELEAYARLDTSMAQGDARARRPGTGGEVPRDAGL